MSTHKRALSHGLTGALTLSAVAMVVFFVVNTGLARASPTSDNLMDAEAAAPFTFAFIGLITFASIIFFTGSDRGEGLESELSGAPRGSFTLFTRDPLIAVTGIGPLFGLCFSLAALL